MFSPDGVLHTRSLRPKRTRQAASDDSIKLPQAKRKRSALTRDTFQPLTDASLNTIAGAETGNEKQRGHDTEPQKSITRTSSHPAELTLRVTKKAEKRSERGSAALTLVSNEFYTVAQLPALPEQIRSRPAVPYSCIIAPEHGYALAATHTDALLWPYNLTSSTPPPRDLITFKLPFPPASVDDPLPLLAFTAKSASGEPGIIAVSPKWGKVVYWETITNASSFVPGQTSSGVQGTIPGLLSGESIKELVNAEPAGFILTLSHGRVAQLTVRDQMGRPSIGVQFLRKTASTGAVGGLFGSIRNVFGADRRKGTPFVRAGRSSKAQRTVVVASEDGELEFWDTNLSIGNSMAKAVNMKEELLEALKTYAPKFEPGQPIHFKVLDFDLTVTPGVGSELVKRGDADSTSIALLASVSTPTETSYCIVEAIISGLEVQVKVVHPIKCYTAPLSETHSWRPRLCLSQGHSMTFVLFETAIVLLSLARIKESPSSQLLMEKQALPEPFQDCIRFQEDTIYRVLAYSSEEHDKQPTLVFAVQAFGVVRITASLQTGDELDIEEYNQNISAKSKIEQAVFFGTNRHNPLDLNQTTGQSFSAAEIEQAVHAISSEILFSTSKYVPKSAPTVEGHLKLRAKALDDLVQHALKHYPYALSRNSRFRLLWNAEKLAAAQAIWKVQEGIQRKYPMKDREMSYLDFTLRALHESRQKYPDPAKGETDHVRHWLVTSAGYAEHLVVELVDCIGELQPMDVTDPRVICDYLTEAVDLWVAAYTAAFKFREDNAAIYGLGDEVYQEGVLLSGYPLDIPRPWTSDQQQFEYANDFVYRICNSFLNEWWDIHPGATKNKKKKMPADLDGKPYDAPSQQAMFDLAARLPIQVEVFSRLVKEKRIQEQEIVRAAATDPDSLEEALAEIKKECREQLNRPIELISCFVMPGAIELAEKIRDPGLLVTLTEDYIRRLAKEATENPDREGMLRAKIEDIQDHAETYFDRFGQGWAFASFSNLIRNDELGTLLAKAQDEDGKRQPYLTWFLKKAQKTGQSLGKIGWINDVVGERNYSRAEKTLNQVAQEGETDVWSKRTEICLAKLASLAATEAEQAVGKESKPKPLTSKYDNVLTLLDIQGSIYFHMSPNFANAIDLKAAQELAATFYVHRVIKNSPSLKRLLKSALDTFVAQQALTPTQLVDLLTLADPVEWEGSPEEDPHVIGAEFSLALKVIDMADLPPSEKDALRILIWRRAMIRDNWLLLNETAGKDDARVESEMQQSSLFRTLIQAMTEALDAKQELALYPPSKILEADVLPDVLAKGVGETELAGLERDLERETDKLREYVDKARLEVHYSGLVSTAERAVRGEMDRKGDEVADSVLDG